MLKLLDLLFRIMLAGKNKHDDVPDAWAMFAEYVQQLEGNKVEVKCTKYPKLNCWKQ